MISVNYIGTLNDEMIKSFCDRGVLISHNYKRENVNEACYELSASTIYYDISENFRRIDINEEGFNYILIKPKQSVVIISKEELNIPNDTIGRVLTKGKLFSIGLLPINTYADPGFSGNLGIILHNNSINYLKIKEDELIAKIEFSILQEPVKTPYSGQHGYKTKIWPIPVEFSLTPEEIKSDKRIGKVEDEILQIYGPKYSSIIKRLLSEEKTLIIAAILYMTFSVLLISVLLVIDKLEWFSSLLTIVLGLISNVISGFVVVNLGKSKYFGGN